MMGGPAALLQLAHPFVATAITEHSTLQADVAQRFHKTFLYMYQTTYGDLETVLRAARTVFRLHTHIHGHLTAAGVRSTARHSVIAENNVQQNTEHVNHTHTYGEQASSESNRSEATKQHSSDNSDTTYGSQNAPSLHSTHSTPTVDSNPPAHPPLGTHTTLTTDGNSPRTPSAGGMHFRAGQRYDALERNALLWVLATLHEGRETAWELLHHEVPAADREACVRWLRVVGLAFGVHPSTVPRTADEFRAYFHGVVHSERALCVSAQAAHLKRMLLRPILWESGGWWQRHLGLNSLSLLTGVLLPLPVAQRYGFNTSEAALLYTSALVGGIRLLNSLLPRSFRYLSAYQRMRLRCARQQQPDARLPVLSRLAERFGSSLLQAIFRSR
jgi:uncharacterized protein (DUF2236 family)